MRRLAILFNVKLRYSIPQGNKTVVLNSNWNGCMSSLKIWYFSFKKSGLLCWRQQILGPTKTFFQWVGLWANIATLFSKRFSGLDPPSLYKNFNCRCFCKIYRTWNIYGYIFSIIFLTYLFSMFWYLYKWFDWWIIVWLFIIYFPSYDKIYYVGIINYIRIGFCILTVIY